MSKLKGRPLRAEEADELLKNWAIPDVAPDESSFGNRSTAYGTPLSDLYKKELAEENRFALKQCLKRPVKLASTKTKRDQHWRASEEVELWVLTNK